MRRRSHAQPDPPGVACETSPAWVLPMPGLSTEKAARSRSLNDRTSVDQPSADNGKPPFSALAAPLFFRPTHANLAWLQTCNCGKPTLFVISNRPAQRACRVARQELDKKLNF